jgi:16S rRNA (adenine1518-N6/adenine1519-N6)-dimethyltransferase
MQAYRPKKRLGQNFLVDESVAEKIVRVINPQPGDHVVEIGPGKGALTEYLLREDCIVTAIEFDRDLIPILRARFGKRPNLALVAMDILKIAADDIPDRVKIIGNLPYNISTAILEKLFEFKPAIETAVFTVQAEVAQRLTADPGNRNYGSLTLIMAAGFEIVRLFDISPESFSPAPEVNSAVVRLQPIEREPEDFENFRLFIRGCFKQKRKTLANSMELGLNIPKQDCEGLIGDTGFDLKVRPEQLTFNDYVRLYQSWRAI